MKFWCQPIAIATDHIVLRVSGDSLTNNYGDIPHLALGFLLNNVWILIGALSLPCRLLPFRYFYYIFNELIK